ncbi:MAG: hypothetical protein QXJ74_00415 [Nitrososphaera sp.]|uniref:hypothetical protein n=1 Tax=Nitrososphaera sp. TaxID=1971748 RepID=UPI0018269E34|nr:hypothetical protein [Nitrososphaera sp.]NWG37786.1 hypothetical protein [Nitrososphaera sp.]
MSGKKGGGKRDDSYFAAERRKNKNTRLLLIGAGIGVAIAAVAAAFAYQSINPPDPYVLGSAHEHAVFAVILDGQKIDFSQDKYQVKSRFIHVENNDGTTIHRHAVGVPFEFFLESVGMGIQGDCFVRDDGQQFCDDGGKQLRFFVNGEEVDLLANYVVEDEDRVLVIYGNQTDEEIQQELTLLDETPVKK